MRPPSALSCCSAVRVCSALLRLALSFRSVLVSPAGLIAGSTTCSSSHVARHAPEWAAAAAEPRLGLRSPRCVRAIRSSRPSRLEAPTAAPRASGCLSESVAVREGGSGAHEPAHRLYTFQATTSYVGCPEVSWPGYYLFNKAVGSSPDYLVRARMLSGAGPLQICGYQTGIDDSIYCYFDDNGTLRDDSDASCAGLRAVDYGTTRRTNCCESSGSLLTSQRRRHHVPGD